LAARNGRILTLAAASLLAVLAMKPIGEDPAYHNCADGRSFLGVPNVANVVSNIVGVLGLSLCRRMRQAGAARAACFSR
jgi:hypothetical protein